MMIRNENNIKAWEIGNTQFAINDGRLYLIHGQSLNVSVPLDDCVFHAGDHADLLDAIKSLADEDKTSVLADFTSIFRASRA